MQPKHPDYEGWVWDPVSQLFVLVPGLEEHSNSPGDNDDIESYGVLHWTTASPLSFGSANDTTPCQLISVWNPTRTTSYAVTTNYTITGSGYLSTPYVITAVAGLPATVHLLLGGVGKNPAVGQLQESDANIYIFREGCMAFDPVAKTWVKWAGGMGGVTTDADHAWRSIYDTATDRFIRFDEVGGPCNARAYVKGLTPASTGAWVTLATDLRNGLGRTAHIGMEGLAFVPSKRAIYGIDIDLGSDAAGRLVRYNLITNTLTDLGALPACYDYTVGVNTLDYDERDNALIFHPYDSGLYLYHLDTATWESVSVTTGIGNARGRQAFWDNDLNAYVLYGEIGADVGSYSEFKFFVWRYAA